MESVAYMMNSESEEEDFMDEDSEDDVGLAMRVQAKKVAPKTTKAAAKPSAAAAKKSKSNTAVVLAPKENVLKANPSTSNNQASSKQNKKTVEEIYQKKTQLEHILLRPDTYSTYPAQLNLLYAS